MAVNFNTIRGVDQWADAFPEQFQPLDPTQRTNLAAALTLGVHEGWKPTAEDVQALADQAAGKRSELTMQDCVEAAKRPTQAE